LPGAVISFSNLFTSHEGSVQDVPVASHGELQVKNKIFGIILVLTKVSYGLPALIH